MVWLLLCLVTLPFALVLIYGAPYLPTRKKQAQEALDLMGLKEGQVFVDLGCGDGAVIVEAARRGYICYGYELNPLVWLVAKLRTLKFGKQVHIYCRNFWNQPLPDGADGVFVFLLDKFMLRLDEKLRRELRGGVLVSYTFQIPHKKPNRSAGAMYRYVYR